MPGFNPRTPCGVRPIPAWRHPALHSVSIHALLAECDQWTMATSRRPTSFNPRTPCGVRLRGSICLSVEFQFQSTHSLRSATSQRRYHAALYTVSIHALLAECDARKCINANVPHGFNPRTPCGVRPLKLSLAASLVQFQSTHSLRSATGAVDVHSPDYYVSIHALLAECDKGIKTMSNQINLFQSTHSLRSATFLPAFGKTDIEVSIHALLAECDMISPVLVFSRTSFNPRTPCGVRQY